MPAAVGLPGPRVAGAHYYLYLILTNLRRTKRPHVGWGCLEDTPALQRLGQWPDSGLGL